MASTGVILRRFLRRRRLWARDGRAHIEYRDVDPEIFPAYARRLAERLEEHEDVHRVEVQPGTGRVVVTYDDIWLKPEAVEELIDRIEADAGVHDAPFDPERPDHPSDSEPLLRDLAQISADLAAIGAAGAGMLLRWVPRPRLLDLGWVVSAAENFLPLRGAIEEQLGSETADLVLGLTSAFAQGLSGNLTSPLVDLVHRSLQAGETVARLAAWERREQELTAIELKEWPTEVPVPERPVPLPEGEVERYADRAWYASVSGLASTIATTNDLERSVTPLLDALPKAARLGREAFAAKLDRVLAARDVLVMDEAALRILDRIDCVVIDRPLVLSVTDRPLPGARELVAAARAAGLRVVLTGEAGERPPRLLDVDEVVPGGEDLGDSIRGLQVEGRIVLAVAAGPTSGLPAADVSVGLVRPGEAAPWGADVIGGPDLADVFVVLRAIPLAAEVSRQSVWIALAGTGVGAGAALGGMRRSTRYTVVRIIDAAAAIAIVNGLRSAASLASIPPSLVPEAPPWHAMPVDEVLAELGVDEDGLGEDEAARRRQGSDQPGQLAPVLLLRSVVDELSTPLTPVLGVGAGLSLATGAVTDSAMVGSVIGLNAMIGGVQRFRTERAVGRLDEAHVETVRVRRGDEWIEIESTDLVPGDVVALEAGVAIPADCRLVEVNGLEVDESSLTGESLPVAKDPESIEAAAVADRTSMVYDGTSVAAGEARAVVVAVGSDTEAQRALWATALERERDRDGIEQRLAELTRVTLPMALGSGIGVAATGFLRGVPTREIIDASIGLAVAAVPEGLPVLATAAQLAAARRLSEQAVLVRNPRAIEALGRVDVVCADKTGTLTEGRIRLTSVSDGLTDRRLEDARGSHEHVLMVSRRATPVREGETLPHPTDQAVAEGTLRLGISRDEGEGFAVVDDIPFEPGRAFHAVLAEADDRRVLAVKGAPETVLERCTDWAHPEGELRSVDESVRAELTAHAEELAAQGVRVLAVAERVYAGEEIEDADVAGLTFVGFLGLSDPPRHTAAASVAELRGSGIDVVMITGDHPETARGVSEVLGLDDGRLITGPEIDGMDDLELREILPSVSVCARVTPAHKVRIVRALQRTRRTVAMTGDGANDAPAIRLADVGLALGPRATASARDAADIILTEERLEVIAEAIAEGRGLWLSVRDAIAVLVGGNVGEISFTFLGTLVGRRPPLNARQLLLVNLLTDVAPSMALAVRPPDAATTAEMLAQGPDAALGSELNRAIAWRAAGTALGATWAYGFARVTGTHTRARTIGLLALVGAQLGQTLAAGNGDTRVRWTGLGSAAFMTGLVQTPFVSRFFGCRPVGPVGLGLGVAGAAIGTAVGTVGPRLESVARAILGVDAKLLEIDRDPPDPLVPIEEAGDPAEPVGIAAT